MFKNSGYTVIHEAKKFKRESVLEMENICPVCGKDNSSFIKEERPGKGLLRNRYSCPECGTEWAGSIYTEGWDKVTPTVWFKNQFGLILSIVYAVVACIIAGVSVKMFFSTIRFHFLLFGVWLVVRLIEISKTGDAEKSAIIRNAALLGLMATVIISPFI